MVKSVTSLLIVRATLPESATTIVAPRPEILATGSSPFCLLGQAADVLGVVLGQAGQGGVLADDPAAPHDQGAAGAGAVLLEAALPGLEPEDDHAGARAAHLAVRPAGPPRPDQPRR